MTSSESQLNIYSINDFEGRMRKFGPHLLYANIEEPKFPCLLLVRFNHWNDYGWLTHFEAYFFKSYSEPHTLGTLKIIENGCQDKKTSLPSRTNELEKSKYFSRGFLDYYSSLKELGDFRATILKALNDVHHYQYKEEDIKKLDDGDLITAYKDSLYRSNFVDIEVSSEYFKNANDMLGNIRSTAQAINSLDEMNDDAKAFNFNLLFGSTIAVLESYLGDAFKYNVLHNQGLYAAFLLKYKFQRNERKISFEELAPNVHDIDTFIKKTVKKVLDEIIFHKIDIVNSIYQEIIGIDLPSEVWDFASSIQIRHDIFHRNGCDNEANKIVTSKSDLLRLCKQVEDFISKVEYSLKAKL